MDAEEVAPATACHRRCFHKLACTALQSRPLFLALSHARMRQHRAPSPAGHHGHPTSPSRLFGPPPAQLRAPQGSPDPGKSCAHPSLAFFVTQHAVTVAAVGRLSRPRRGPRFSHGELAPCSLPPRTRCAMARRRLSRPRQASRPPEPGVPWLDTAARNMLDEMHQPKPQFVRWELLRTSLLSCVVAVLLISERSGQKTFKPCMPHHILPSNSVLVAI